MVTMAGASIASIAEGKRHIVKGKVSRAVTLPASSSSLSSRRRLAADAYSLMARPKEAPKVAD